MKKSPAQNITEQIEKYMLFFNDDFKFPLELQGLPSPVKIMCKGSYDEAVRKWMHGTILPVTIIFGEQDVFFAFRCSDIYSIMKFNQ